MKFHWQKTVSTPMSLVDFIATQCKLSKGNIKKALVFGGGWLTTQGRGKAKRVRRASLSLRPGDVVAFYYDAKLLSQPPQPPQQVAATAEWGIWFKPADVPTQGTTYGDRNCLEYLVQNSQGKSAAHAVHRLDKEASGLIVIAYNPKAAAALSRLWQTPGAVSKVYRAWVNGAPTATSAVIELPLDGKAARTSYQVLSTGPNQTSAELEVTITTGRFHQIRRHLAAAGHPLLGDPKYNPHPTRHGPLQLVAHTLAFTCPITGANIAATLPDAMWPRSEHAG